MGIIWPEHNAAMHITHNDHKTMYQSVEEWIEYNYEQRGDWASEAEISKAIASDSIWEIHWYPHTPIGSYCVLASTFEVALSAALKVQDENHD